MLFDSITSWGLSQLKINYQKGIYEKRLNLRRFIRTVFIQEFFSLSK